MVEAWDVWEGVEEGELRVSQEGGCGQTLILCSCPSDPWERGTMEKKG